MVIKAVVIALCFAVFVSADVIPLAPLAKTTVLRSSELPLTSIYSSSVYQTVANDGHGLSYSTVQTHNPVHPILEARLIQPVIRYNVGSLNLPLPNIGLFVHQNPTLVSGLSGLVPVQQIEPITSPGSSSTSQNAPAVLPADSINNGGDSVTIEAN